MPILFDTGALELLRRRNRRAEKLAIDFFPPVICTHVVGEFLYGQLWSKVSSRSLLEAREFLESFEIYRPDIGTAATYARLRTELRAEGHIIPDPDYWIAAHAIQKNLRLTTIDSDFKRIPELQVMMIPSNEVA